MKSLQRLRLELQRTRAERSNRGARTRTIRGTVVLADLVRFVFTSTNRSRGVRHGGREELTQRVVGDEDRRLLFADWAARGASRC